MKGVTLRATALLLVIVTVIGIAFARDTQENDTNTIPGYLPSPTGPYKVGTTIFHLTDKTRRDTTTNEPDRFRELIVQVWYPTSRATGKQKTAAYLPNLAVLQAMKREEYLNLKPDVLDAWRNLLTHSFQDAPLTASPQRLPLLLFSHGFGMSRSNYTAIVEDFASHGYVVAAIDHPYASLTALPDGRVLSSSADTQGDNPDAAARRVEAMAQDAVFVLDILLDGKHQAGRFANRIDPKRVGILGHSIGGAAALEACRIGARFKACADLDGAPFGKVETEGVSRPFLVMLNVPEISRRPPPEMGVQRDNEWMAIIAKKKTPAVVVKIENTNHFSFSDLPFVVPTVLMRKHGGTIAPQRGHEIMTRVLRAFFSRHLNGGDGEALEGAAKAYPEVTLKAFSP